jgi:hypothetical protein
VEADLQVLVLEMPSAAATDRCFVRDLGAELVRLRTVLERHSECLSLRVKSIGWAWRIGLPCLASWLDCLAA